MPQTGMRRVSLALASAALITMGGLSGVGIAHAASDAPNHVAGHAARDATSYLSLNILPDDGENAIYNFVNSATSSIDVTIYELNDVTLENDLVSREKAGADVRVILDQAQKSYNTAAYNLLTAGGVGVVYSSTSFTYTHQKTITVNNDESYISTGNFDNTYYLDEVTEAGGTVTGYSSTTGFYIHAKTVIADYGYSDEKAFVGSENFSSGSLNDNRELGIITTNSSIISGL